MGEVSKNGLVFLTVFAESIRRREIIGFSDASCRIIWIQQIVMSKIELIKWILLIVRKACEIELSAVQRSHGRRSGDAHDSVRPVEIALGINHPPLSVNLLHVELSGSLISWSFLPSSINIPVIRSGMLCKILFFRTSRTLEILVRVNLAGPVDIFVLTIGVNERKECC